MYIALFSVALGSILTLAQAAILFKILEIDTYVDFRAIINTMNNAAPFLCLGFDSAAPVLRRMSPNYPFFWNILAMLVITLFLFLSTSLILSSDNKLISITLGLAASTSVAGTLIIANHYRVQNKINKYFISINITDKVVRTFIILSAAFLFHEVLPWTFMVSLFCFGYVVYLAIKTGCKIKLNFIIFKSHLWIALPYMFSAIGIITVTRLPFYVAYLFEDSLTTAKVDIWLLFSMFLLIPMLNKSKIDEALSVGVVKDYIIKMRLSWKSILIQEILVCTAIILVANIAVFLNYTSRNDLFLVVLPLITGMVIIASVPNYLQLACFANKISLTIKTSLLMAIISLIAYFPKIILPEFPVPLLFIFSSILYCLVGVFVANKLNINSSDFWRWRGCFFVIFIGFIELIFFSYIFDGKNL